MSSPTSKSMRRAGQQGYAILMVILLTTLLLLATISVAPNVLTQGKREKEKEMVWRGNQYVRGIKLYYRKMGRFPTSLDDLTKPKVGSLRFMRQAYKDPMNKQDGSWRLIYVGPSGQLIGSLKPHPASFQLPQAAGAAPPGSPLAGTSPSQFGASGQSGQPGQVGQSGQPGQPGNTASAANSTGTGTTGTSNVPFGTDPASLGTTPPPLTDNIIGGNIIGVGSKINQPSIMVYDKATKYLLFEFIWDPSKDAIGLGQSGMQTGIIGQPVGQPLGQSPFGQQPGQSPFGQQPGSSPNNPQQNPPLNPPQGPPLQQNPPQ